VRIIIYPAFFEEKGGEMVQARLSVNNPPSSKKQADPHQDIPFLIDRILQKRI